jgi:glycosyltransferase involved in cell wall biosynthesis
MMASDQRRRSISVFFPAYNDAETISSLVSDALAVLSSLADDYEVIVVNDGSTDATAAVLDELARKEPRLRVVHHGVNRGYGGALRTGFESARKELIFYTDGDGQYDVRELLSLYPLLAPGVDAVNGFKVKRADGLRRRLLGAAYNRLAHVLFTVPVRDVDCDFRLIRASAARRIALTSSGGAVCVEMVHRLAKAGCVFAEVPVNHYPRAHGRSQFFTARRVARTALDFLLLWLRLVAGPRVLRALPRRDGGEAARCAETVAAGRVSETRKQGAVTD